LDSPRGKQRDDEKPPLGQSLLICLIIAAVYGILAVARTKGYQMGRPTNVQDGTPHKIDPSQSTPHQALLSTGTAIDQPFLIDAGIIQVVLVITAAAFTIRAFTVSTDSHAVLIFGTGFFFPIIGVAELANWVFVISGTISILLYAIYLWEWIDKNLKVPTPSVSRRWLSALALSVHLIFLFWLAAILILQVLVRNFIPS
jgi:hypothetical protein